MTVAAIILAAGGSRRLGQPKQLLLYRGETLLRRAVRLAYEAGASPVLLVLGKDFAKIRSAIQASAAIPVHNQRWRQGMGTSIQEGMRALSVCAPESDGVLLMGCDQPRLTAEHLRALIDAFATHEPPAIVASAYAGALGVPAVFPREIFAELRGLGGDRGARSVIERAPCAVIAVEFAGGEVDIDAPGDLAALE